MNCNKAVFIFCSTLPSELEKERENRGLLVYLRSPDLYVKNHITDSINIPTVKLRNNLNQLDKKRTIILIGKTGLNGYFTLWNVYYTNTFSKQDI